MTNFRFGVVVVGLFICAFAHAQGARTASCKVNLELGVPGGADVVLCHDGYAAGYSYQHKIPLWCAYWIDRNTVDVNVERSDDFRVHPAIPPEHSSGRDDYRGSGFDRGHCAPSASVDYSTKANSETFLYTNMFPQLPGFNRDMMGHKGVWGFLENEIRSWARSRGRVYVISGAHVGQNAPKIGSGMTVPTHFFKVVIAPNGPDSIAFWMPHEEDTKYNASQYLVAIDFIEEQTGLDLLALIRDEQENALEAEVSAELWQ
ncbi:DNA/RNA non-specific endonuclease [Marinobacter shengliensis]|uniref:DNA/RNA non-specific endonuclease n=1 Tax=Marinobacter shengliensis TaxID=1389223 RepID=UPI001485C58A|nr:DNA/RNA non-specific endonuclease [Marinobacter shengliensis]